ncbi:uncharacterized protein LOC118445526 [Vespa mandarinia]|uniref:uncharacterized protein LOC118445526 n=1 Tax=Vespa mandarinia TaxID=7446 RepID=UPI001621270F|nr:uncharacterized protein LOC118445526 [Vespa mandarinia]
MLGYTEYTSDGDDDDATIRKSDFAKPTGGTGDGGKREKGNRIKQNGRETYRKKNCSCSQHIGIVLQISTLHSADLSRRDLPFELKKTPMPAGSPDSIEVF